MMGDFFGLLVCRNIIVPNMRTVTQTQTQVFTFNQGAESARQSFVNQITTVTTITRHVLTLEEVMVCDPLASRGAFKIADGESPRPVDRVFLNFNYFDGVTGIGGFDPATQRVASTTSTSVDPFGNVTQTTLDTVSDTAALSVPARRVNVDREIFGFEKTFLDGNASIGLRAPLIQQDGSGAFGSDDFGDLSVVLKYAWINNRETGNVLSSGLVVTVPTGPSIPTLEGNLNDTLLQPWVGYILNSRDVFLIAFHSVVVPTDSKDVTLLFNDVSVGYRLYRAPAQRLLTLVAPTFEAHVTTPLSNRGSPVISVPDVMVLTGGVHIGFGPRTLLSLGVGTPITGPRVYDVEALALLNWRF
jgi:hypothetical protein